MIWRLLDRIRTTHRVPLCCLLHNVGFVRHRGTADDYLIVSSNVDLLSTLGVTCVPALKNNVEVSVKWAFIYWLISRSTTCSSTMGIISGKDVINSTQTYYLRFRSLVVWLSNSS